MYYIYFMRMTQYAYFEHRVKNIPKNYSAVDLPNLPINIT